MSVPPDRLADAVRAAGETLPITGHIITADLVRHTTIAAEYHRLLTSPH